MHIKLLGTRGSIAVSGPLTIRYGGNTTCAEVTTQNGNSIIIDAGTGIRYLSKKYININNPIKIFITHAHWDHLQGLPFFIPIFLKNSIIDIFIDSLNFDTVKNAIIKQMSGLSHPVDFKELASQISFIKVQGNLKIHNDMEIFTINNNHPGISTGLKVISNGKIISFVTDNEIGLLKRENRYNEFCDFLSGSDIIIHDGQYISEDMRIKTGWGHTNIDDLIELYRKLNPAIGVFTHHDPDRADDQIDDILSYGAGILSQSGSRTVFKAGVEGEIYSSI